jgi:hypothetical protein
MPTAVRPWVTVIQTLGFPVALVIFFLGQQAGYIPSEARTIAAALNEHTAQGKLEADRRLAQDKISAEALVQSARAMTATSRVLLALCTVRGAEPEIRRACLGGSEMP